MLDPSVPGARMVHASVRTPLFGLPLNLESLNVPPYALGPVNPVRSSAPVKPWLTMRSTQFFPATSLAGTGIENDPLLTSTVPPTVSKLVPEKSQISCPMSPGLWPVTVPETVIVEMAPPRRSAIEVNGSAGAATLEDVNAAFAAAGSAVPRMARARQAEARRPDRDIGTPVRWGASPVVGRP